MRYIAKNIVAAGVCDEVLIQVSYAIGVAQPIGIYVNSFGTTKISLSDGEIAEKISEIIDLRPASIETLLGLRAPIYSETAAYGHMGRKNQTVEKIFYNPNGEKKVMTVELFTWERLDLVPSIKVAFKL